MVLRRQGKVKYKRAYEIRLVRTNSCFSLGTYSLSCVTTWKALAKVSLSYETYIYCSKLSEFTITPWQLKVMQLLLLF